MKANETVIYFVTNHYEANPQGYPERRGLEIARVVVDRVTSKYYVIHDRPEALGWNKLVPKDHPLVALSPQEAVDRFIVNRQHEMTSYKRQMLAAERLVRDAERDLAEASRLMHEIPIFPTRSTAGDSS